MSYKNKSNDELKMDLQALESKISRIKNEATAAGRALSASEESWISDADAILSDIRDELRSRPEPALTQPGPYNSRPPRAGGGPFATAGQFFQAVREAGLPSGRVDQRLFDIRNAAASGLSESVSSDGGFLVQQDFGNEILQNAFEYGRLARLCRRQPISSNSNSIKIPGVDETSRATGSRFGGIRSYWLDEASEATKSKPKFRSIELNLHKNFILVYCTDELLADATALESFLRNACPKELAFTIDDAIIRGSGAGQPLGILNAGCLVTVSKETGQDADTIVAENVLNMVQRTIGNSSNYIWLYNKSCLKQIYSLSLAVGTAGVPLFLAGGSLPNQPENRLLGLPMVELEQCSALGDVGDLILADFQNGYILADKGGVQADMSIHVRFEYAESVFRFLYRVDSQPILASAITPYKGGASNTQSYFIALAAR